MKPVVIIGYGPAGVSAAIYLKRANIDTLMIGKDYGALQNDSLGIENFYGLVEPISGVQVIKNGIAQAKRLGVEVVDDAVIDIKQLDETFEIITEKNTYEAKTVLLATGKQRAMLSAKGFQTYRGKGISFCATCDGFFYRKKSLALIGDGSYMQHELSFLEGLTDDITIFTNEKPLTVDIPNHKVITEKIVEFVGDGVKISEIKTENGSYPIQGVFVAVGTPSSTDFAQKLGILTEKGNIVVNEQYETNIPGLYAAGDAIGGKLQIAKAVYDGMMAADFIGKYIKKQSR